MKNKITKLSSLVIAMIMLAACLGSVPVAAAEDILHPISATSQTDIEAEEYASSKYKNMSGYYRNCNSGGRSPNVGAQLVGSDSGKFIYYIDVPATVTSKLLKKDTFIKYTPNGEGLDDQINISATADISGEPETWDLRNIYGSGRTQTSGIVDVAETRGLILENGAIGYYYPSRASFFIADLTGKESTKAVNQQISHPEIL